MIRNTAEYWVKKLNLLPHPEGGHFKKNYFSPETLLQKALPERFAGNRQLYSAIYFLLAASDFSCFHRLKADEIWHFYAGNTLQIYSILPNGQLKTDLLGTDLENGAQPQVLIPAERWFAAQVLDQKSFTLAGCTLAPGFDFADFEMADREKLTREFPQHEEVIVQLTRPSSI